MSPAPLRLVYVSHSFPPPGRPLANVGGRQRHAVGLQAALANHPDVALTSLVLRTSAAAQFPRMWPYMASLLVNLPGVVARERADVVLFGSMVTAALAPTLQRIRRGGVPLAVVVHGQDITLPNTVWQWWVRRVIRAVDGLLPVSDATGAECVARGAQPTRVHMVPCAVDTTAYWRPRDRPAERRLLLDWLSSGGRPIPGDAFLVCGVGRHMERKGFHWFAGEVLPRLPERVHFVLAGTGPLTPEVREAAAQAGVAPRLHLLGKVTDERLGLVYRGSDCFVMPNVPVAGDMEGFGIVMLEAGLSGLPIVATDLEGIRSAIRPGMNGTLVPARDADAFAAAILPLMTSPGLWAQTSERTARYTAATWSWDAVVQQFVTQLRELAGRRPEGLQRPA
ncbi:MAG: glycosyltransferase family 4 protein [Gemmatimonadales bacterium]|nr:glycosyltransferase family 4 protein [Gemmatimonadales bacterium]